MFDFTSMIGNYEKRKVALFTDGSMTISTAAVTDGKQPFETGIQHPDYYDGGWIIVEAYDTRELAQAGHDQWVLTMTKRPPKELRDCCNCFLAHMAVGGKTFKRKAKP